MERASGFLNFGALIQECRSVSSPVCLSLWIFDIAFVYVVRVYGVKFRDIRQSLLVKLHRKICFVAIRFKLLHRFMKCYCRLIMNTWLYPHTGVSASTTLDYLPCELTFCTWGYQCYHGRMTLLIWKNIYALTLLNTCLLRHVTFAAR